MLVFNRSNNPTFGGVISGSGNLIQAGTGILTLAGNNTYLGGTKISAGSISLNNANAVQDSTVTVSTNNSLLFNTNSGTIATFNFGGLAGNGNIRLADGSHALTLSTGGNGAGTTYSGVLSGPGGLTKTGSGMLLLGGSNLFTGTTTVSGGTLAIGAGGSINASSSVAIGPAGTLQVITATTGGSQLPVTGNLTLDGGMLDYAANGSLSPGESAGTLALNPGQSQVVVSNAGSGTPYLRFAGAASHTTGATVGFSTSGAKIDFLSNPPPLVNGILPYAFYGPLNPTTVDFATLSTSAGMTLVSAVAYSSSTAGNLGPMAPITYGGLNVAATGSQSNLTSPHQFNSLKLVGPASVTMTGSANMTLACGGLICSGSSSEISGGSIWAEKRRTDRQHRLKPDDLQPRQRHGS